eukprot:SAG22_NODE_176_length_16162_cov_30.625910_9_plen_204_part_00
MVGPAGRAGWRAPGWRHCPGGGARPCRRHGAAGGGAMTAPPPTTSGSSGQIVVLTGEEAAITALYTCMYMSLRLYRCTVPQNSFFVLNEYKTRKKYGEKKVDIKDPEIITSLKIWLKHRPTQTDSLFYDTGRDFSVPANSASITKILLGASKRLLDGKSVGSSLIRHMYLSSKYADTVQEMEKDADLMGHSPGVQQTVYTKKD